MLSLKFLTQDFQKLRGNYFLNLFTALKPELKDLLLTQLANTDTQLEPFISKKNIDLLGGNYLTKSEDVFKNV